MLTIATQPEPHKSPTTGKDMEKVSLADFQLRIGAMQVLCQTRDGFEQGSLSGFKGET